MNHSLIISLAVYLLILFSISLWLRRQGRVESIEGFLVAGRRMPLGLTTATLIATWFGAGSLLAVSDEVYQSGLSVLSLEPFGTGACLILAGLYFARPLWRKKLLTFQDFYRQEFGVLAERISALYAVGYLCWIAVQLKGVAGILHIFTGLDLTMGVWIVALIATSYTLLGGIWSVALTDCIQLILLVIGLIVAIFVLAGALEVDGLTGGLERLQRGLPSEHLLLVQRGELSEWLGYFVAGSIGCIASQDLMQRVFSARSEQIAQRACIQSGIIYILMGAFPVFFGLAAYQLFGPGGEGQVLSRLVQSFTHPTLATVIILALCSAVLSTIDSAILAPSGVLAQNLLRPRFPDVLKTTQWCVALIGFGSALLAIYGGRAIELLDSAYSLGIAPCVVLFFGLYSKRGGPRAASVTLALGLTLWVLELAQLLPLPLPSALSALLLCTGCYLLISLWEPGRGGAASQPAGTTSEEGLPEPS